MKINRRDYLLLAGKVSLATGLALAWHRREDQGPLLRNLLQNLNKPSKNGFIELDDVSPAPGRLECVKTLDHILDQIEDSTGKKIKRNYFVIPQELDAQRNVDVVYKLGDNPEFCEYVKSRNDVEIGQHGLHHYPMDEEKNIFEFTDGSGWSNPPGKRMDQGKVEIRENLGVEPKMFKFPNWAHNDDALKAAVERYPLIADYDQLIYHGKPMDIRTYLSSWQLDKTNIDLRIDEAVKGLDNETYRITLHPQDVESGKEPYVKRFLKSVIEEAVPKHNFVTYSDWLEF